MILCLVQSGKIILIDNLKKTAATGNNQQQAPDHYSVYQVLLPKMNM